MERKVQNVHDSVIEAEKLRQLLEAKESECLASANTIEQLSKSLKQERKNVRAVYNGRL